MNIPFFNYNIKNNAGRLDVYIDGTIVDAETQEIFQEWFNDSTSVSFKSFRAQILDSGIRNIKITINSMGGQVGDAMAMHDFIKQLENDGYAVETVGMGMICSAATYILSASSNSKISRNSYYMIHNVSGGVRGNVNEIESYSNTMRKFNNDIRDFYVHLTGKTADEITAWMDAETWFNGKEAVDNGFVKALVEEEKFTNTIDRKNFMFKNTAALAAYNAYVKPENTEQFELNTENMNKFVEAVVNGLKEAGLFSNEKNKPAVTEETVTNAITKAFDGIDLTPEMPENAVQDAVNTFFEKGLPENILNQIKEAVKPENFVESDDYIKLDKRIGDIENKVANGAGQATPTPSSRSTPEDKYDVDGIGWGEEK